MGARGFRTKAAPWISLGIGLVLSALIIGILVVRTDFFSRNMSRILSRHIFGGTSFSLEIGHLSGIPWREITANDFRIRYEGSDYSFDVVRIERLRLGYRLGSLVAGRPQVTLLELERPHVWIKPDASGAYILPATGGGGAGALPDFNIEHFMLYEGQVIYQKIGKADAVRRISIEGSVQSKDDAVSVRFARGSAEDLRRGIVLRMIRGGVRYERDPAAEGGIVMDSLLVRLDRSQFTVTGRVDLGRPTFDVRIGADPIDIVEIARLIGIETGHSGELQGVFGLQGVPDSLAASATLNGVMSGFALDGLFIEGLWRSPVFSIQHVSGGLNGAVIAGAGSYRTAEPQKVELELETSGLDLSMGFARDGYLPQTDLAGLVRLTYLPAAQELFFDLDLGGGHIRSFPFAAARIIGALNPDSLVFSRIESDGPSHTIRSRGMIRDENLRFDVELACARHDTIFGYLGIDDYRAELDLVGIISGSFADLRVRASGDCRDLRYRMLEVPAGEMELAVRSSDTLEVHFDLAGDSCFIDPVGFSGIDLSLAYLAGTTSIRRLVLERSDLSARMRGAIRAESGTIAIVADDVEIRAIDEIWKSGGNFQVNIDDGLIVFDDLQLHSRLGAMYFNCSIDSNRDLVDGVISFERFDLALLSSAGLLERPVSGRVRGFIGCVGSLEDPDLSVSVALGRGLIDTIAVDTLSLAARYSAGGVTVDSFHAHSPLGGVTARARLEGASLRELYRDRLAALAAFTVEGDVSCRDVALAPFLRFSDRIPFDHGTFTGRLVLSDSLAHPSVRMEGMVMNLGREGLNISEFEYEAQLSAETVRLQGRLILSERDTGSFSARLPLRREEWFYSIDDEGGIYLELVIPPSEMAELPSVTDLVAMARGSYSVVVNVEGSVSRPMIFGELTLDEAELRLAGMEERLHGVSARVLLHDTLITVAKLRGREGKNGSFDCAGKLELSGWRPAAYDLTLRLDRFLIASVPDILASVSGTLAVGTGTVEGRAVPSLQGALEVKQAEVFYVLDDQDGPRPPGTFAPPSWLARIDLEIPGNAWLKTPDANIEMRGEITFYNDHRGAYLRGELELVRGWYNIYANKFRIRSGKVQFVLAEGGRPVVYIEAETPDPGGRRIFLTLAWLQDDLEPRVTLTHEDPGYSETDIWKMLGGGMVREPGDTEATWDAVGTAHGLAANYVERILNSQMEGITIEVESIGVQPGMNGEHDRSGTVVAVGKYLSEGLYVKYRQGLSISSARHIEVEYRINRLLLLRSELIKYSERVLQGNNIRSSDEFNVDLKLRWEY